MNEPSAGPSLKTIGVSRANTALRFTTFATSEADAPRGRYGAIGKEHVTGAGPVPQYWALPETSFPNQAAAVPDEPPLNFQELSQVEPCGTYPEIQESLERLGEAGASSPPSGQPDGGDADAPAGGPVPRRHVLRSRRRPFKQRKKD